mmetsp:Transcript_23610/g.59629  ORF Transcript_23610/g.59629 Transcript_23610/m.59629 type:complete len:253 (+) Transcript_23610:225-983(+)
MTMAVIGIPTPTPPQGIARLVPSRSRSGAVGSAVGKPCLRPVPPPRPPTLAPSPAPTAMPPDLATTLCRRDRLCAGSAGPALVAPAPALALAATSATTGPGLEEPDAAHAGVDADSATDVPKLRTDPLKGFAEDPPPLLITWVRGGSAEEGPKLHTTSVWTNCAVKLLWDVLMTRLSGLSVGEPPEIQLSTAKVGSAEGSPTLQSIGESLGSARDLSETSSGRWDANVSRAGEQVPIWAGGSQVSHDNQSCS